MCLVRVLLSMLMPQMAIFTEVPSKVSASRPASTGRAQSCCGGLVKSKAIVRPVPIAVRSAATDRRRRRDPHRVVTEVGEQYRMPAMPCVRSATGKWL